jgi:solute carrier family 35 protein
LLVGSATVSATYFTVIGNICKFGTVLLNILLWDKHTTAPGLASLMLCLVAAFLYQQAPTQTHYRGRRLAE